MSKKYIFSSDEVFEILSVEACKRHGMVGTHRVDRQCRVNMAEKDVKGDDSLANIEVELLTIDGKPA